MLVAEYIVNFLKEKSIDYVFGYPGGMVTYLIDAFDKTESITAHSLYHEQSAAFAACGYSQKSGKMGVAYATSGPGATNLITGICHAFYESVPTLFITGQVNTHESKGNLNIRQKGFQETEVVEMVKTVTKFSAYVESSSKIRYYLEKAYFYSMHGRPGPVLLDIPIDIQRTEINPINLVGYHEKMNEFNFQDEFSRVKDILFKSRRPILLLGNGINIANSRVMIRKLLENMKIPVVTSMIAVDILPKNHPLNYGFIGSYGMRHANLIISKSDLIISIGSRLDVRQTGSNISEFAKDAKIIRVDIDQDEFTNKIKEDEVKIYAEISELLNFILKDQEFSSYQVPIEWFKQCEFYKESLDKYDDAFPNHFISEISKIIPSDAIITTDVGQNQVWVAQSFINVGSQRILFSGGHGAMGYSLPSAIGAYYVTKQPVYCFVGDGGLQINIQELQFIIRENIPIKIIVMNNNALGMIRHFQEMYLDSNFSQTTNKRGYSSPDFVKIANAYGISSATVKNLDDLRNFSEVLLDNQPFLLNVDVGEVTFVYPKLEFNKPIYDQVPLLDRNFLSKLLNFKV